MPKNSISHDECSGRNQVVQDGSDGGGQGGEESVNRIGRNPVGGSVDPIPPGIKEDQTRALRLLGHVGRGSKEGGEGPKRESQCPDQPLGRGSPYPDPGEGPGSGAQNHPGQFARARPHLLEKSVDPGNEEGSVLFLGPEAGLSQELHVGRAWPSDPAQCDGSLLPGRIVAQD
jgi:hypothetical protein